MAIPDVNMILQVAVDIIFAFTKSSFDATFGIDAVLAGSNIAEIIIWKDVNTNASHSIDSVCTKRIPRTAIALRISQSIINFRRLNRSVIYPANGENTAKLSILTTIIRPRRNSESE